MTPNASDPCIAALERNLRPELFRVLADPTRLGLLGRLILCSEPSTVGELGDCCGVHISGVSRHLAALREAGVVHAERRGREVLYRPDCAVLVESLRGLADAIEDCRASCCPPTPACETTP